MQAAQAAKGPRVAAYKRARRNKGLDRVHEFMSSRYDCLLLDSPTFVDAAKNYNMFRSMAIAEVEHIPAERTNLVQFYFQFSNTILKGEYD